MGPNIWDEYAEDYDSKVFSLTSVRRRREQILDKTIFKGRTLNMGCGSATYLNKDFVDNGYHVVATDSCQKMIEVASRNLSHPNLEYIAADSCALPFSEGSFDNVVSVNSILPPSREDVHKMFSEAYRVLRKNGLLVAFLVAFDCADTIVSRTGTGITLDYGGLRAWDTDGWQCYHTRDSIAGEMLRLGCTGYEIDRVPLKTKKEKKEIERLYGYDSRQGPVYEWLLTARKGQE